MIDLELCEQVATIWVENGGDVEGFKCSVEKIKEHILNLQTEIAWIEGDEFWESHGWEWEENDW